MSEQPKVTIKDTKATILSAYQQVLETLQTKGLSSMNVDQVKSSKMKSEAISMADQALQESNIELLMNQVTQFQELVKLELEKYEKIKDAIEAKNEELSELFEIEKTAYSLAALVDSHQLLKENMQVEMASRKEDLQKELNELRDLIERVKAEEGERQKREKEAYEYELKRRQLKDIDSLTDNLDAQKKAVKDQLGQQHEMLTIREKALKEREALMSEKESEFEALQAKIDEFPEIMAVEVKRKVGKEKGMIESRFETEKKFMTAASESAAQVSAATITEMAKSIETLKSTIEEQQGKLDSAYKEIKDMAVKTVEGAGNNQMFQEMKHMMGEKTGTK